MKPVKAKFATEAALCEAFIATLPKGWTAYPEWGGFDILLVHGESGYQVGVEAKLTLNVKVLLQAVEPRVEWQTTLPGPDFRAVLVPSGKTQNGLATICALLGVTVIDVGPAPAWHSSDQRGGGWRAVPRLPDIPDKHGWVNRDWHDCCPASRVALPDFVPECEAGKPAPVRLTEWKIRAMKIAIIVDRRGWVHRADFKALGIDLRRWKDMGWLAAGAERGQMVWGERHPDFRREHPTNYAQIEAQADKWMPPEPALQGALL